MSVFRPFDLSSVNIRHSAVRGTAAIVMTLVVSGCSLFDPPAPKLDCPQIKIDRDTVQVTKFKPSGHDLTDAIVEAEIIGYTGECSVDPDTNEVDMKLMISFLAKLGPAAAPAVDGEPRKASFEYFVALPDYYPHPAGKHIFKTEIGFPPNVNQVRFRDADVNLKMPLSKDMNSGDARVYIGMQLTKEELEFNRKNRPDY